MSTDKLAGRLRAACNKLRTTSMPLADLIPLMQQAADALDPKPITRDVAQTLLMERARKAKWPGDSAMDENLVDDRDE